MKKGILAGLVLLIGVFAALQTRDRAAYQRAIEAYNTDVRTSEAVSPEQNGYVTLLPLLEEIKESEGDTQLIDLQKALEDDPEAARNYLEGKEEWLAKFEEASEKPFFKFPLQPDVPIYEMKISYNPFLIIKLAIWKNLEARYLLEQGQYTEAWESISALLRMGFLIQETPLFGIHVVGLGILKSYTLSVFQDYVQVANLRSQEYMGILRRIEDERLIETQHIIRAECAASLAIVQNIENFSREVDYLNDLSFVFRWPWRLWAFHRPATVSLLADRCQEWVRASGLSYDQVKDIRKSQKEWVGQMEFWMPYSFNGAGKVLARLLLPSMGGLIEHHHRFETEWLLTKLLLALKAYQGDHQTFPENLTALVPKYFEAVPADPFGGAPIHYQRDDGIIYGIGPDLTDDGGDPEKDIVVYLTEEAAAGKAK